MKILRALVIMLIAPLSVAAASGPALAATAHNSQAGALGPTSNVEGPTVDSPRVKHAHKHRHM